MKEETELKLTARTLDSIMRPAVPVKLWGAGEIARFLGCSVASIYRWAEDPAVPIYRPGGRYYAHRHELEAWLKTK